MGRFAAEGAVGYSPDPAGPSLVLSAADPDLAWEISASDEGNCLTRQDVPIPEDNSQLTYPKNGLEGVYSLFSGPNKILQTGRLKQQTFIFSQF